MATIVSIADVEPFFPGEHPSNEKFTEEFTQKFNAINSNHVIINDSLELLLQGISGGGEQAKIPLALSSAPDGWTRDISFSTDHVLRVTDGSTLPPGASPNSTGGGEGGSWTITGTTSVAESDHTHTMNAHTHFMSHSHSGGAHTHFTALHTHSDPQHAHAIGGTPGATTSSVSATVGAKSRLGGDANALTHTHDITSHNHGGTVSEDTITTSASSGATDSGDVDLDGPSTSPSNTDPNSDVSSGSASHNHTPSHDATWRPKYLNVLICSKD